MNKRWAISVLIICLAATSFSCGISVDLGSAFSSPTPLPPTATSTAVPATPTNTAVAPTQTVTSEPAVTLPPAAEPALEEPPVAESEPTAAVPTATPELQLQVIVPENSSGLTFRRVPAFGSGSLQKVLVSPDGNSILLSYSSLLALLKMSDFSLVWKVDPGRFLSDVAFSKDGKHLITASPGGSVHLFDVATGNMLATVIPQREGVRSLSLSGNGEYFAVLDYSGTTTIWDAGTGKQVQDNNGKANPGGINTILLSPGGGTLLIDGIDSKINKQIQQWNVTDGKYKIGLLGVLHEMANWKFSPDAKRVFGVNTRSLTASPTNTLTAWNAQNGAILRRYDSVGIINDYQISPDGATIIVATEDNQIHLLKTENGDQVGSFTGHTARIAGMAFTPDSQGVISISVDGKAFLWDVVNQKSDREFQTEKPAVQSAMSFAAQGQFVALLSPDRKQIGVVDMSNFTSGRVIGPEEYLLRAPAVSPQGNLAAAMDDQDRLILWDVASGQKLQTIVTKTRQPIHKLKFAPNEKLITSLSEGQIIIWDVSTGKKLYELTGQNDFAYSPTEKVIVSDSTDNRIYLSDADTGKKLYSSASDYVDSIAYSPGGEYIAFGARKIQPVERGLNNLIYQLDSHTRELLAVQMPEIPGAVSSMAYSPDLKVLAASDAQGNVQMWSLLDGKKVALFEEIAAYPSTLSFNKEGTMLYVGGGDGTLGIISTTGASGNVATAPATTTGEDTIPDLSAQPYTHSKGSVTVNLPMGWQLKEQSPLVFLSTSPNGKAAISFKAVNTVKQLTDEAFLNFIDGCEQAFDNSVEGLKETDRGVEPSKGTGFVTNSVTLDGSEYIFETYYTRDGAIVYLVNFLTQKNIFDLYLPLYKGVFSSLKINKEFINQQTPYGDLNSHQNSGGKFTYSIPPGWGSSAQAGADQTATYNAPDGTGFVRLESATAPTGDDTQTFIAIQTLLEKQEGSAIIVRRDKTDTGGWQITYNLPDKKKNGIILGIRIDALLQTIHVQYPSEADALYRPLAQKVVDSLTRK